MSPLYKIYSGQKILITGHTGFKGSWLVQWLHHLGAEVSGIALDPITDPNLFDAAELKELCRDYRVDLCDYATVQKVVLEVQPDIIFHLAAQPLVRESYRLSRETFNINVMGSVHVFEAARSCTSVQVLVHVGTDKVYENEEWDYGYRENDPLGGHDPYSASKAAAEIAFQSYLRSFFYPVGSIRAASGRAGNVIGGGDWAKDRIVPDAMKAVQSGKPIEVRNPASTRPWQHVLEALSGYVTLGGLLLQKDDRALGSWNFGPNAESIHSVKDLVEAVLPVWGSGSWVHTGDPDAPHEAGALTLCIDKARQRLGWAPKWDFRETIKRTVQWYRGFYDGKSPRELCKEDIAAYMRS
ncbi:MAG TPA: CDP-glucose 4,6-dehydratase [Kiritimatiellia bacterium]|nr:CDP-glucose 4,6-dehydratase [Kiritimatiellia bacterium]